MKLRSFLYTSIILVFISNSFTKALFTPKQRGWIQKIVKTLSDLNVAAKLGTEINYKYLEFSKSAPIILDSRYHLENAAWFSDLSSLAYEDFEYAKKVTLSNGFSDFLRIHSKKTGTDCFVVYDDKIMILVFRGTEINSVKDLYIDSKALQTKTPYGGSVHIGFYNALNSVWPQLSSVIQTIRKDKKKRKLFITGHSLGAALATMAANRMEKKVLACYTFGSPRVGNWAFKRSYKVPTYRFVNSADIITRVPFGLTNKGIYRHVGKIKHLDAVGNVFPRALDKIERLYSLGLNWKLIKLWKSFRVSVIENHGFINYSKALKQNVLYPESLPDNDQVRYDEWIEKLLLQAESQK
ncbi:MAG: hypothetical protein COB02_07615 [Candidatus Cloacimonadota bacterium]|nr:MAG: hypothetical protein COB02_07615 [Candidatus Cloacimonadota bacterium]